MVIHKLLQFNSKRSKNTKLLSHKIEINFKMSEYESISAQIYKTKKYESRVSYSFVIHFWARLIHLI